MEAKKIIVFSLSRFSFWKISPYKLFSIFRTTRVLGPLFGPLLVPFRSPFCSNSGPLLVPFLNILGPLLNWAQCNSALHCKQCKWKLFMQGSKLFTPSASYSINFRYKRPQKCKNALISYFWNLDLPLVLVIGQSNCEFSLSSFLLKCLLAPTGALVLMMVRDISVAPAFSDFHSVHWCNWCYKCHSKSLKQYQCNWYLGDILGIFWGYFKDILGIFCEYFGDILGTFLGYLGNNLGIFWGYFEDILGIFWGYFGDILGIF